MIHVKRALGHGDPLYFGSKQLNFFVKDLFSEVNMPLEH